MSSKHKGRQAPQFKVGDIVTATDSMGTWRATIVGMRKRTGSAAERCAPNDDGWAYETAGTWQSGWAVDEGGSRPDDDPTLRQLWNIPLTLVRECAALGDDVVARAQQSAAAVAAQDGLDAEEAAAFEQCMMDNLAQEGLL